MHLSRAMETAISSVDKVRPRLELNHALIQVAPSVPHENP